jgi:hypothetical protein
MLTYYVPYDSYCPIQSRWQRANSCKAGVQDYCDTTIRGSGGVFEEGAEVRTE